MIANEEQDMIGNDVVRRATIELISQSRRNGRGEGDGGGEIGELVGG